VERGGTRRQRDGVRHPDVLGELLLEPRDLRALAQPDAVQRVEDFVALLITDPRPGEMDEVRADRLAAVDSELLEVHDVRCH
jgi:hypothetical protein